MNLPFIKVVLNINKIAEKVNHIVQKDSFFSIPLEFNVNHDDYKGLELCFNGYKGKENVPSVVEVFITEGEKTIFFIDQENLTVNLGYAIEKQLKKIAPFEITLDIDNTINEYILLDYVL